MGATIPLFSGATGKVFLSGENKEKASGLIKKYGLPRYTSQTITDEQEYLLELERVDAQGYAVDIEEYLPGIKAVAVALNNRRGLPAALWVVGMSANMDDEKIRWIAGIVKEKAEKLRIDLDEGKYRRTLG